MTTPLERGQRKHLLRRDARQTIRSLCAFSPELLSGCARHTSTHSKRFDRVTRSFIFSHSVLLSFHGRMKTSNHTINTHRCTHAHAHKRKNIQWLPALRELNKMSGNKMPHANGSNRHEDRGNYLAAADQFLPHTATAPLFSCLM